MKVLLFGGIFRHTSFAGVNTNLLVSMTEAGIDAKLYSPCGYNNQSLEDNLKEYCPWYLPNIDFFKQALVKSEDLDKEEFDVAIHFLVDPKFNKADSRVKAKKHIFYTVWSHINFPESWAPFYKQYDAVFCPSFANQKGLKKIGIDSIVIPHGINPYIFYPVPKTERKQNFRFLMCNSICDFKGADISIQAFMEEFKPEENVELFIQSTSCPAGSTGKHGAYYEEYIKHLNRYPNKQLKTYYRSESVNHSKMAALYNSADCVLSVHRGDGFGLVPIESLACRVPVITTRAHGPLTYLPEDYFLFVDCKEEWTDRKSGRHHFPDGGDDGDKYYYYEPNKETLKKKMREIFSLRSSRADINLPVIDKNFTYEEIGKKIKNVIESMVL